MHIEQRGHIHFAAYLIFIKSSHTARCSDKYTHRMSRVKQPIEEAKEFARSLPGTSEGDEARQQPSVEAPPPQTVETSAGLNAAEGQPSAVAGGETEPSPCPAPVAVADTSSPVPSLTITPKGADTFIHDVDGNPIAYASEQETLNFKLRDAVLDVERKAIQLSLQLSQVQVPGAKQAMDALNPVRSAAMNEYNKIFAWPELPWSTPSELATECSLESNLQAVKDRAQELSSATDAYRQAPGLLDELTKPVQLMRRKAEIQSALAPVSELLLQDDTITQQLIVQLHEIAQGDVFSFTRSELARKQRELDALREDLTNTTSARNDALMANDVRGAETLAFREVDICEKIIERVRGRVQTIFMCDSDVKEFCDKYAKTQELSESLLTKHEETTKCWVAQLQKDIVRLTQAREEKTERDVRDEEDHEKKLADSLGAIRSVQHQQQQNWEKIVELLQFHHTLSTQRERLVEDHLAIHAGEVARRAKVGVWIAGCDDVLEQLRQSANSATTSLQWIGQIRSYVNLLCTQIENKRIDEEAWQMRVQEQLDYLDAYKHFKTMVDDLAHRKELRIISLQRVVRNYELQIKEATETLDPNTKKYEHEIKAAQIEIQSAQDALAKIHARAQEQHGLWKIIEESLEEAQVDFVPPDIAAEKELCEKKSNALAVARQFVNTEQETVDKDTMKLRKLKTSNVVAIEGLHKRRTERAESIAAPPIE